MDGLIEEKTDGMRYRVEDTGTRGSEREEYNV